LACGALAEQSFQHVADLPSSAEIHELLAESNQRTGRRVEAVEEWRKALEMASDDRRIKGRLAESLIRDRKYEDAEQSLKALVAGQPENGEWQYLLGETLFEQRRADAALPHLIAAARLMPGHLPASEVLGRTYLTLGQPDKAVALLEKAGPSMMERSRSRSAPPIAVAAVNRKREPRLPGISSSPGKRGLRPPHPVRVRSRLPESRSGHFTVSTSRSQSDRFSTSRGLLPSGGPIMPSRCIMSSIRAARP
jgi:hypothetical protein